VICSKLVLFVITVSVVIMIACVCIMYSDPSASKVGRVLGGSLTQSNLV